MFRNLSKSPLNDSSGLTFLEYLQKKDAASKARDPPSIANRRKRIFRSEHDVTADEFSIHRVAEKENTVNVPTASSQDETRRGRSSSFKPTVASTPMVPTTQATPYRATKKSIGIQNSPLVEEVREVPETPEAVLGRVIPKTPAPGNNPTSFPAVISPPPEFGRTSPVSNPPMYPELETVGQQQKAIPEVIPATQDQPESQPVSNPVNHDVPAAPIQTAIAPTAAQDIPQQILSNEKTPAKRPSIRCVSPERIMEIIHGHNKPNNVDVSGSPRNLRQEIDARVSTPEDPQEVATAVPSPQYIRTPLASRRTVNRLTCQSPQAPLNTVTQETPKSTAMGRHHRNLKDAIEATPRTLVQSPEPIANDVEDMESINGPTVIEPGQDSQRAPQINQSDYFVAPPTPVIKNFKLVLNDCMKTRNSGSVQRQSVHKDQLMQPPPTKTTKPKKIGPRRTASRASELTISRTDRSSIIVPSTQKRRLHSTTRELTPISSPRNICRDSAATPNEREPAQVETNEADAPVDNVEIADNCVAEPPPLLEKPTTTDDDLLFKKPAPKSKKVTKKRVTALQNTDFEFSSSEESSDGVRRSKRVPKPLVQILPYSMTQSAPEKLAHHSINYNPKLNEYIKEQSAMYQVYADAWHIRNPMRKNHTVKYKSTTRKKAKGKSPVKDNEPTMDEKFDSLKQPHRDEDIMPPPKSKPRLKKTNDGPKTQTKTKKKETNKECVSIPELPSACQSTFDNNFTRESEPVFTSGVNWSSCTTSTEVTRTLVTGADDCNDIEYPRVVQHAWGSVMAYMDWSRGVIRLKTIKKRSTVKDKPLVLNVVQGEAIVNVQTEDRSVRLGYLDQIKLPPGTKYTMENLGDVDAIFLFTWV